MTEQEAIERIKIMEDHCGFEDDCVDYECEKCSMAREAAISALEELQQYRALGTLEELREAKEKQIPYKPKEYQMYCGKCKCGAVFLDKSTRYCGNCGQAIDWSDTE